MPYQTYRSRTAKAEAYHREALEIRRRLVKHNPQAFGPDLATSCFLLAIIEFEVKQNKSASKALLQEALSIYEQYPHLSSEAEAVRSLLNQFFTAGSRSRKTRSKKKKED